MWIDAAISFGICGIKEKKNFKACKKIIEDIKLKPEEILFQHAKVWFLFLLGKDS